MFASDILNTPFSVYDTFVIEEKYGFNKTTPKTFVLDHIKGWVLGAIIGGGLLALMAFGGGPWSVDGWIALKEEEAASSSPAKSRGSSKLQQAA